MATIVNEQPIAEPQAIPAYYKLPSSNLFIVDDKVYSLSKLKITKEDVLKTLKTYYENEVRAVKDSLIQDDFTAWSTSWDNLMLKYDTRRSSQSNTTQVPSTLQTKPIMIYEGQAAIGKLVIYKPFMYKNSLQTFAGAYRNIGRGNSEYPAPDEAKEFCKAIKKALKDSVNPATEVIITFKQDLICYPMMFALLNGRIRVAGKYRTYHTFSEWRLCTGNTIPETFFNSPHFEDNVNTINLYSPATTYVNDIPIASFLQDQYVTKIHINTQGGSAWSTTPTVQTV